MLDKRRIIRFHAALSAANLRSQKLNILAGYGVESTKDLTAEQAEHAIDYLNSQSHEKIKSKVKRSDDERKHTSIALTLINKLGIYATNGDWGKVNAFLQNPKIAGKLLYEMNVEELLALQRKLRVMVKRREDEAQQKKYLETNN